MKTLKHKKTITKRSSFPYKVIGLVLYLLWVQPFGANHLYASERKINIEVNDVTLIDVLKQIEAQSDYVFFYNNADIDTEKKISINMKDANIKDVLDKILNEYSYRINNKRSSSPPNVRLPFARTKSAVSSPTIQDNLLSGATSW